METIDLGLIKAIEVGLTAPSNINMLWYDDNVGIKAHKYYDTVTLTWTLLATASTIAITTDVIPKGTGTSISDGTWSFDGNSLIPITTSSNIGDDTHRVGTLFISSTFNYSGSLVFSNGTVTTATLTTGGWLSIGPHTAEGMLSILATGSGTAGIVINTASTQDAKILFGTNNAVTKRAKIWVDDTAQSFNFYTTNNDTIFWNGVGAAQAKTFTLFYDTTAKFESKLGIGVISGTTSLNVQGDATNPLFKLNNANYLFADKLRVNNNGDFYSGSINGFGGFGSADFTTDHLNYNFNTSYQTYLAFTNAQGSGNKGSYGIIGSTIANADSDYRLVVLNNDTGTLGSVLKVISTATNNANDGLNYTNYGINVLSNGAFTNTGAGTFYKVGVNLDITNGDVNRAINIENGLIRVVKANQPAYGTLTAGDFYYDTAANILANGDFVVGMKA